MRMLAAVLAIFVCAHAQEAPVDGKVAAVDEAKAREAIAAFETAFQSKDVEEKQYALYDLHDVPHDLVIARLETALKERDPEVRNVAALALGGQGHNMEAAGQVLMRAFDKDRDTEIVLSSVLEAMGELKFLGYWPEAEPLMKDPRNAIVIRTLDLLGANKDYRALPRLLDMYHVAMPKRFSWSTGTVTVDTGTAGDADQKAAEAKFNAKYGRGGSKMKAKAKAKAKAFDERNFQTQLRKCVKAITGEEFDTAIDFENWYLDHYVEVWRKIAQMEGRNPEQAAAKARAELPDLRRKIEDKRKKQEEEFLKERNG